jgi:hypothetical protein
MCMSKLQGLFIPEARRKASPDRFIQIWLSVCLRPTAICCFGHMNKFPAESGVGIFPKTARLNHACSAGFNSVYTWREKEKRLGLALILLYCINKLIYSHHSQLSMLWRKSKREKLVISTHSFPFFNFFHRNCLPRTSTRKNLGMNEGRADWWFLTLNTLLIPPWRNYLSQTYNFNCSCLVCSLPPKESHASDLRLQSMSTSYNKFATWGRQEIHGLAALDLVRNIWRTGEEEGYLSECVIQIFCVCYWTDPSPNRRGQLAADATHIAAAHSESVFLFFLFFFFFTFLFLSRSYPRYSGITDTSFAVMFPFQRACDAAMGNPRRGVVWIRTRGRQWAGQDDACDNRRPSTTYRMGK